MARSIETKSPSESDITPMLHEHADRDERLGEAIEEYLAMAEAGTAPDPQEFALRYPDLGEDLPAALDGLAMVRGLVGDPGGPGGRLEAGRRVAGYRIVRELGRGGMGIVYEAVHVDLDRPVALKVLGMHAAPDSSGRRRFLNEAKTAAGLHHTHIVPVFDVGQVGGLCYYAMQRIEGCGLDRVVKALRKGRSTAAGSGTGRPMGDLAAHDALSGTSLGDPTRSWFAASGRAPKLHPHERSDDPPTFEPPRGSEYYRWVARAGQQAADALAHAHRRGVIHRDVKPSNLLVDARGTVWVADFGLARRLADPAMTQTDSLLGTPRYMSPEQSQLGPVDGRTDVYSLGTTLYELLTLRPPFEGKTAAELILQIRDKEPLSPRKLDPRLPRDLETIVLKAIAKRPQDRYESAGDLAEDLGRFLATEPVKARRIGPVGRAWRFTRRHPSLTAVTTLATVAILTTATVAYARVLEERNKAVAAQGETQKALDAAKVAQRDMRSAMRQTLLREATSIRTSGMPDRRKTGLRRLKEAVDLGPDAAMKAQLRDEAVEFLAIRDIEPRPPLPAGRLRMMVFSPETGGLATLSQDGSEVSVWDVARGERTARLPLAAPEEDTSDIPGPRFPGRRPPFGPGLAAAGASLVTILPGQQGLRLFDPAPGGRFADLPMPGRKVLGLLSTPDGRRIITIDAPPDPSPRDRDRRDRERPEAPRVCLWDRDRGDAPIAVLTAPEPKPEASEPSFTRAIFGRRFPLVAVSPDGRTIATAYQGSDEPIALWDASDGKPRGAIQPGAALSAIALGPDGAMAAACAGTVSLWDVETLRPLPRLGLHQPIAGLLRFSPDGSMLAVAGAAGIEIWDPSANALLASAATAERVQELAFAPDGLTLAAAVDDSVKVWAVVEPIGRSRLAAPESRPAFRLKAMAFGPGGLLAATFFNEKTATARFLCVSSSPSKFATKDHLRTLALGFDDRGRLVVPEPERQGMDREGRVVVLEPGRLDVYENPWDARPRSRIALPEAPPMPIFHGVARPADSPEVFGSARSADGRTLALMRGDLLLVRFGDGPDPAVAALRFPEPTRNDRGGGRGRGRATPGPGPAGPRPEDRARSRGPGDVALSPRGDRIYTLAFGGELHAWSVEGDRAADLGWDGLPADATRLALSLDGRTLALGLRTGEVALIDTRDGSPRGLIPAEADPGWVSGLAFSPAGDLAVGSRSGSVRLWSLRPGVPLRPQPLVTLPGDHGEVRQVAFDPKGTRLAVGDDSGVDVWDLDRVRLRLAALGLGW